ncbi:MAG TPA: LytTR family DNA-binding domain-containing protein [Longimicrobiales bacterium]|nr:LytTR family DNA-binding domain-containing protein [Longimicrobiales bacterium]
MIVDDEPAARNGIRKLLALDADVEVVGEARDGKEAIALINELRPDLLFLDVQMPEANGFDVLEAVAPNAVKAVVFCTAYDQHAVRAFEVQALDYLLKPFEDERFRAVLERAKDRISSMSPEGYVTRILVRESGTVTFVAVDSLDWIESADYYVRLHSGSKNQLVKYTLNDLERQLDPKRFLRVHRTAIVNVSRVKEIRIDYQNRHVVVLGNNVVVPLSRSRKAELEEALARAV